jgi:hypothetical protein
MTQTLTNGGVSERWPPVTLGCSNNVCGVPEGWHAIAAENSRAMEEDRVTRKPLCLSSPSQIEG